MYVVLVNESSFHVQV